nr:site-specific integrase [uncultured Faecalibacterium sp.]
MKTSKGELYITDPKSKAGFRTIPLSAEAYHAIKAIINRRPQTNEMMVDGYCGFISIHSNGIPKTSWNIEYELREIAKAYNSLYPECQLPNLTPHVLRHTFCTRKVSSGMNIKAVQYLMGHSSVQITLDVYTSIDADMIKTEFAKVAQM